jgi:hypothetical protein
LTERLVEHRRAFAAAQAKEAQIGGRIAGNGSLRPGELGTVHEELERSGAAVARCVEAIHELGGLVKDLDRGLVDFPARRGDEDVLLCWQLGEETIEHWHGLEEGFAGRRPLPL